jgi:hypothetical protein
MRMRGASEHVPGPLGVARRCYVDREAADRDQIASLADQPLCQRGIGETSATRTRLLSLEQRAITMRRI